MPTRTHDLLSRLRAATTLLYRGEWERAELELAACRESSAEEDPRLQDLVMLRLGELQRRRGRFDDARHYFEEAATHPLSLLGQAALALDRGEARMAVDLLHRYLRRVTPAQHALRAPGLALLVRARLLLDDLREAEVALQELREMAREGASPALRLDLTWSEGRIALATAQPGSAQARFEEAAALCEAECRPFEAARIRIELSQALAAQDRLDAAEWEVHRALSPLRKLGAAGEVRRGESQLAAVRTTVHQAEDQPVRKFRLTRREEEVLRLLAEGLSDREMALRLRLTERTIHRHVASIMAKTGVSSRAAAVEMVREEVRGGP